MNVRMRIDADTTALVVAAPTPCAPPKSGKGGSKKWAVCGTLLGLTANTAPGSAGLMELHPPGASVPKFAQCVKSDGQF